MGHELYCAGHLIQAGVAFARATGDVTLLTVARRFADLIDEVFGSGDRHANRRPSRGRGRARRAVPADGRAALPRAGRHAHVPPGVRNVRRRPLRPRRTTRTPSPFARHARSSGTPCAPSTSPPASPTSTPRRETRRCSRRCSRQWDDLTAAKTYLTGGDRLAPLWRGDRRSLRAAARPRLLRDLRGDRQHHVELAHAARHGREPLRRPARADALQRLPLRAFARRRVVLLLNPLQSRTGERRHRWNPVACCPPNVMRLLASLHHYLATTTRQRRSAAPVRVVDDPRRRVRRPARSSSP